MKYADISGLSGKELLKKSNELRAQVFEARMKNTLGQLANPMTIREMRRDIARLKTAMTAKTAAAPAAKAPVQKKTRSKAKTAAKG